MLPSSRAFTLLEVLAVVAVVVILASLLVPAAGKLIARANGAKCMGNLKTISAASAIYSGDHNGDWPPCASTGPIFANSLIPYLGTIPRVNSANFMNSPLICPGGKTDHPEGNYRHQGIYTATYNDPDTGTSFKYGLSYAQNVYAPGNSASASVPKRLAAERPSEMMLYMDMDAHHIVSLGGLALQDRRHWLLQRHNGKLNVAFADGSVKALTFDDIPTSNSPIRLFWSGRGRGWPD